MHVPFFLFSRWICLRLLLAMFIIIVFLPGALEVRDTHADQGNAYFDISPSFFPSFYNRIPRAHFTYDSRPDVIIQDSLHVKNTGTVRGTVNIYPADAVTSDKSGEAFPTNSDLRREVGGWIKMSNQHVTLNPGQSQDISFSLRIPAHVRPGDHAGGIIADEPDRQISSSQGTLHASSMKVHTREIIGVRIYLPGPRVQKLNATDIVYSTEGGYQSVKIGLTNTGTQFLYPAGSLRVTDAAGQQLQNVPLKMGAFLAQTSIHYPVYIHHTALKPGTYTAILNLKYEGGNILHYVASFVVPMPQLPKSNPLFKAISDLVSPNTDFFSALTPMHYILGIGTLLFILSALFFWSQKIYQSSVKWKQKITSRKPKDGEKWDKTID